MNNTIFLFYGLNEDMVRGLWDNANEGKIMDIIRMIKSKWDFPLLFQRQDALIIRSNNLLTGSVFSSQRD